MPSLTNFPNGISSFGVPVFGGVAGVAMTGNYWFVNPATGADGNSGASPASPLATLYQAHNKAVSGNNDVIVLIGNGLSTGTARLSTALAQTINPAATAGTLNWTKNATHLIGIAAPTSVGQRARIAPPTGTYTQATFGSGNFINVTGAGCVFQNIDVFNGFSTGGTNQIAWIENGGRNCYMNMNIQGIADAASAADAGSRSLKVTGTGENTFIGCTIGEDTTARSVANASLEFAGGTPRNTFMDCTFPFFTSNAGVLGILGTGAACMDRWQQFKRCQFINSIKSTSTQMTALLSLTSASPGGLIDFDAGCAIIGITKWGDTNGLANSYISQAVPTGATSGIAVNPA